MVEMCKKITPYRCKKCNQDMLFFTTVNNVLIDYKGLMSNLDGAYNIKQYLENKSIRFIKCLTCNEIHIIDWTKNYPTQLIDKDILKKFGV